MQSGVLQSMCLLTPKWVVLLMDYDASDILVLQIGQLDPSWSLVSRSLTHWIDLTKLASSSPDYIFYLAILADADPLRIKTEAFYG